MPTAVASSDMQVCISNCLECHRVCLETVAYCLGKGGQHAEARHIVLLIDCAQICVTSADFMSRESDQHRLTCGICAEVCEACAADCESMSNDLRMKACAEVCRRCAASCREMAKGKH